MGRVDLPILFTLTKRVDMPIEIRSKFIDPEMTTDVELAAETAARQAADENLQDQIDALSGGGDPLVIQNIQNEINATQDGAGLNQDGSYSPDTNTNFITTAVSLKDADSKLDTEIKSVSDAVSAEETRAISAESTLQSNIDAEESARIAEDLTFLKLDGSRAMQSNLDIGNYNINNINKSVKKILITTPTFTTVTNNGTLNLSDSSTSVHFLTGTATNYSVVFPDATTLSLGVNYEIYNRTSSPITLKYNDGSTIGVLSTESVSSLILQDNSTSNGIFSPFSVEVAQAAGIANYNATASTSFQTTVTNAYQQITDFVVTPAAGKYAVMFNCSAVSTNNNSENYVAIYKDTTIVSDSERLAQSVSSNFRFQLNTLAIVDFNGTEQLRVYVKVTTGTLTVNARTGVALRLGPVG